MKRDFAYEALAEVTDTDWDAGRGELNAALKSIREQEPELTDSYLLGAEIHDRAKAYHETMGEGILLTPTALAKHWQRVVEQRPKLVIVNAPPAASSFECETCQGDKMVLVGIRPSPVNPTSGFDEMAPCPDCNSADVTFYRADGSRFRPPDPAVVRARMQ